MKGKRHVKEVALYQGGGAISRKWCYIKEVAPYQGSDAISRRWRYIQELASCPDETRPVLQTAVRLTSPPTSTRQTHHQSRSTSFGEHSVLLVRS
jgi:hypothetical protein